MCLSTYDEVPLNQLEYQSKSVFILSDFIYLYSLVYAKPVCKMSVFNYALL